jgi:hypothetical protein
MIILDTTSKKLEALLSGAAATNNPVFICSYVDITSITFAPGANDSVLNGSTAVTVMASPVASTQRQLKYFSLYNNDTAPVIVTVRYNDSSTLTTIFKTTLQVGYRIEYTGENGFKVYDTNGDLQTVATSSAGFYQTLQINGSNQPQEAILDFSSEFTNTDDPSNTRSKIGVNTIAESKVTNLTTDLAAKVPLAGGTMTGPLILPADPVTALGAATKQYVDNAVVGLDQKPTADVATIASLPAYTYNNGGSGVGATITGNSNGALTSIDGVAPYANMIILVKNETAGNAPYNGLYTLSQVGDGSHPYILTRSIYMDSSSKFDGALIPVDNEGTANANTLWLFSFVSSFVTGTSNVAFIQTGSSGSSYTTIQNNTSSVTQRTKINLPAYLNASDNSGNTSTDISIGDELEEAIITSMKLLTNN